jgi:hypothetical protein
MPGTFSTCSKILRRESSSKASSAIVNAPIWMNKFYYLIKISIITYIIHYRLNTAKYNNNRIKKSNNNRKSNGITKDGGRLSDESIPTYNPALRINPLTKKQAKAMAIISILLFLVLLYERPAIINNANPNNIIQGIKISWTIYSILSI